MAERELSHDLGAVLERYARLLKTKEKLAEAEARRRAIDNLEDLLSKPDRIRRTKLKAKDWSAKAKTADTAQHQEAVNEVQDEKYAKIERFDTVNTRLQEVKAKLGNNVPAWLKVDDIRVNPEAAEFAVNISLLPSELQKDPNVLYREAARLYWSTDWNNPHLTNEAAREARALLDRTFQYIQNDLLPANPDFGSANNDVLWQGLDRRLDIYRTQRMEIPEDPGDAPKVEVPNRSGRGVRRQRVEKDSPEYKDWWEDKVKRSQVEALDRSLKVGQAQLDAPVNADIEQQAEALHNLIRDLETGMRRTARLEGKEYPAYDMAEAMKYKTRAEAEKTRIDRLVQARRRLEEQRLKKEERKREMLEQGAFIEWNDTLQGRFRNPDRNPGDILPIHTQYISPDDLKLLFEGEEGQLKWLTTFRREIMGMGKDEFKPTLHEIGKWEEAEKIVKWLWGERNEQISKRLKDRWDSFPQLDLIFKGIVYRPAEKIEMKASNLRWLSPKQMEELLDYDLVEITKPHYSESIRDIIKTVEEVEYFDALDFLNETIQNPFNPGQQISRDALLVELQRRYAVGPAGGHGGLTPEQDMLRIEIQRNRDRVGVGVFLRDKHMLSDERKFIDMSKVQSKYQDVVARLEDVEHPLSATERTHLENQKTDLYEQFKDLWFKYSLNTNPADIPDPRDYRELNALKGLSPVEIEVRKRTIATIRGDLLKQNPNLSNQEVNVKLQDMEWKIQDAIWAARNITVDFGEATEIAAKMGIAPMKDLLSMSSFSPSEIKGAYPMEAAFTEPLVRVLNESLFADRFSMGGKRGDVFRDLFYTAALRQGGYDVVVRNAFRGAPPGTYEEYQRQLKEARREGKPEWRVFMDFAEKKLGITYSELLRPEMLATGLQSISTTWRNERSILEPVTDALVAKRKANKLPEDAILDGEGLGIQYNAAIGKNPEDVKAYKRKVLGRIIEKKPSAIFDLLGREFAANLEDLGLSMGSVEWRNFRRAIGMAEMEMWRNNDFRAKPFDFGNRDNFNSVIPNTLRALGVDATPERTNLYFNAIVAMQHYMNAPGITGSPRIESWLDHKFKNSISLVSSDFNWKETDFNRLSMFTLERRINDFLSESRAKDLLYEFGYQNPDLLSPPPGKETDSLLKIEEFKQMMNNYCSTEESEQAALLLFDVYLDFNYNRASRTIAGWIPGAVSLMRRMGVVDLDEAPLLHYLPGWEHFLKNNHLAGRKLEDLPKSLAQAVSWSVALGGYEGNAWDEFKVAGQIAGAERRFMFVNNPKVLHKLAKKYQAGAIHRLFVGVPRKYWWIVPVATVAVASLESIEEEKKKSGH